MARADRCTGRPGEKPTSARRTETRWVGGPRHRNPHPVVRTWTLEPDQHVRPPGTGGKREVGVVRRTAVVIAGALLLLTGCNEGGTSSGQGGTSSAAAAPPAQVAISPSDGATDVSPTVPLEINVTDGTVGEVTLVDNAGAPVTGTVGDPPAGEVPAGQPSTEVFTPDSHLAYGTTYTLTATA